MRGMRHKASGLVRAAVLAAVVLAPIVAGGHHHDPARPTARDSCALCVVAYHAPAATTTAVLPAVLAWRGIEIANVASAPILPSAWSPEHGRAPPFALPRSSRIATAAA
ncbi:MAG TPA: hypothetical protein VEI94_11330 [Candidatus Bathyarchaeia archaeon]|nr:hypothetical protein [Candidatus Bathyarchaeia archaeon]